MLTTLKNELEWLTDSPDSLLDLFQQLEEFTGSEALGSAVPTTRLDGSSQFGVYVRAAVLEFNTLPFASVASSFSDLVRYYESDETFSSIAPKPQLRRFLHEHAVNSEAEVGRHSFQDTETMLHDLQHLNHSRELVQAHFLRYLNCLHHREYEEALDSLHRYFDYLAPQEKKYSEQGPGKTNSIQQYAILNLGILYFGFGHFDLAVRAIQETVRIAQQNNDHNCLMHALALLCRVAQDKGAKGDTQHARQLLERCVMTQAHATAKATKERKAYEVRNAKVQDPEEKVDTPPPPPVPVVDSQSWLSVAKFQIENIDRERGVSEPKTVWDALLRGVRLNTTFALDTIMGTNLLVRASSWNLFGNRHLSKTALEMQLKFYSDKASTADSSLALCNLAQAADTREECAELIKFADEWWPHKAHSGFEELKAFTRLNRALMRGDMVRARELGREIYQLMPSKTENYQLFVESHIASANIKYHEGQLDEALREVQYVLELCESKGERGWMVQLLLWVSKLHQKKGNQLSVLPYVLQCLSLCKSLHFDNLRAEVTVELAKIHLSLGAPDKAVDVLTKVLPQILEHCGKTVTVDTWFVLAKCMAQLAGAAGDEQEREELLWAAVDFLESARKLSKEIDYMLQLRDICYLLTRLYHSLGEKGSRNAIAAEFNALANSDLTSAI